MATQRSSPTRARGGPQPPQPAELPYDDEERRYAEWIARFTHRLCLRLPGEAPRRILAAADRWSHHYRNLDAEEAAEVAAMWWRPVD